MDGNNRLALGALMPSTASTGPADAGQRRRLRLVIKVATGQLDAVDDIAAVLSTATDARA